jgi:SAM-dependent methyltransferase
MADPNVLDLMRADWNERAREDANYYVAFGRRGQDEAEFFSTAAEVLPVLEGELKRLAGRGAALEIGCGPGRLLRPMSRHFGEIHGVDVSDEMVRLARERLADVPNARVHAGSGADLAAFAAESFDFVYSYAVFQHIPSREVVFRYLEETRRVLKPGGVLRCQINGLPQTAARYTTWDGVRIAAAEVAEFARTHDFQLLSLDGVLTQYMWATLRKMPAGWAVGLEFRGGAALRNVTNAHTGEAAVPTVGPLAAVSLWIEDLPRECDLNHLAVAVDGRECRLSYLGEPENGITQLNTALPEGVRTGLAPVEVRWLGRPLCAGWVRLIPPGPRVPRICTVTDGVNLLAARRTESGMFKVSVAEVAHPASFRATLDGRDVRELDSFCTDPLHARYEFNFRVPDVAPGVHELTLSLGRRVLAVMPVEVA